MAKLPVEHQLAMLKEITFFPDTNLFLQCQPLEQVDWSLLGDWDEITVVITRPVQSEIDGFKAKGNNRQAAKARSAASLFASLLDEPGETRVLRIKPKVMLTVRVGLRPENSVKDELNYDSKDDQLVGISLAFQRSNMEIQTSLLSYDNGPMFSAKLVGLPFSKVPDEWLLPPEADDSLKRIRALEAQVSQYEKIEPIFEIKISKTQETSFTATISRYEALEEIEIQTLMRTLLENFPAVHDFGSEEPQDRRIDNDRTIFTPVIKMGKDIFTPASPQEILNYQSEYRDWMDACEELFNKLHGFINGRLVWPKLEFNIENRGSRPGIDVQVDVEAEGPLGIARPAKKRKKEGESKKLQLPVPPSAPKGHWKRVKADLVMMDLARMAQFPFSAFADLPRIPNFSIPEPTDPNTIYWKSGEPGYPQEMVSLSCQQWRHANGAEDFTVSVFAKAEPGNYSGSIKITVHAANLTRPVELRVPVRVRTETVSCKSHAENLVQDLVRNLQR